MILDICSFGLRQDGEGNKLPHQLCPSFDARRVKIAELNKKLADLNGTL
jgi:hypothetical protein